MPPRKNVTREQIIEAIIDRFYGVPLIEIEQEYNLTALNMYDIVKRRRTHQQIFEEALIELDVDYTEYMTEIKRHDSMRTKERLTKQNRSIRSIPDKTVDSILHEMFKKPVSTEYLANKFNVRNETVSRMRKGVTYKDKVQAYIKKHDIQNPSIYLDYHQLNPQAHPSRRITDEQVKRFFYSYISGSTTKRACAIAEISPIIGARLLQRSHSHKSQLMKELILSEGFTFSSFDAYRKRKQISQMTKTRKKA